jgi:hypothetical protein
LFGRHVGRRAGNLADAVCTALQACQAEVGDARLAPAIDHDVGRLQISVQYPLLVSRRQTRSKLLGNLDALVPGQTPDATQQTFQVLAIDKLHRQKVLAIHLVDVI